MRVDQMRPLEARAPGAPLDRGAARLKRGELKCWASCAMLYTPTFGAADSGARSLTHMRRRLQRFFFDLACKVGRPIGGLRPRRIYDRLARGAFTPADLAWHRDKWGNELLLSPHYWIDRHIVAFGVYDDELSRFLAGHVRPGDVCLDVGANIGVVTLQLARQVGPAGIVHAFEPLPTARDRLRQHVERNKFTGIASIHAVALTDRSGEATFHFASDEEENQGMGSLVSTVNQVARFTQTVALSTLDEFARELQRIDLIKVDVQGSEVALLEGGRQTLQRLAPDLLLEVSHEDLRQGGTSSRALCLLLAELGYEIFLLRGGRVGRRIDPALVSEDFDASNVFCTKKRRRA